MIKNSLQGVLMMNRTGLVYDPLYLQHDTGSHPERAERLVRILNLLQEDGIYERLTQIAPRPATIDEIGMAHAPGYIEKVRSFAERGGGTFTEDTAGSTETYRAALLAAGGVLAAIDALMDGKIENAFALVRPPGHHATPAAGMGFCFFNNVAVGARYAIQKYGLKRVLIVDWDVHHGNGTEAVFYSDPAVLYFSVHRSYIYPGTGWPENIGEEDGKGFNINVPLPAGTGNRGYEQVFSRILQPVALSYQPELVLISAGQDAHHLDPLGGMSLTERGYRKMTEQVLEIAGKCCNGRAVAALEGGYSLEGLSKSVLAIISAMEGRPLPGVEDNFVNKTCQFARVQEIIGTVSGILGRYWPVLI